MKLTDLTPEQTAGIEALSARDNRTADPPLDWYHKKLEWDLDFLATEAAGNSGAALAARIAKLLAADKAEVLDLVEAKEAAIPDDLVLPVAAAPVR